MTLRLKSYFQAEGSAGGVDWDDLFDSVPMLKSEVADGAGAVGGYVDTTTTWSTPGAKLWSFRNNGVEKASVDLGGKVTGSSFVGNGSAITSLNGDQVLSGKVGVTYGGTGIDAHLAANGKLLIGNGTGYTLATLTAGTNITITNGAGSITIDAPAGATVAGSTGDYQYNSGGNLTAALLKESIGGVIVGVGGFTHDYPGLKPSGTYPDAMLQIRLADDGGWSRLAAGQLLLQTDVFLTREGANALRLGPVDSAAPSAQRFAAPGSRAGTDTNAVGADLVIASGIGTGSAAGSHVSFSVPIVGSTGTTAQSVLTALALSWAAAAFAVPVVATLGTLTSANAAINYYAAATWNDATYAFTAFKIDITNTASAAGSLLGEMKASGTSVWSVRVDGLMYTLKAKYGTVAVGAGNALLGANCPAVTVAAPYTWLTWLSSDGSTVYVPVWK